MAKDDLWSVNPGARTPPSVDMPREQAHGNSCLESLGRGFKTLLVLALIAGAVWGAIKFGGPALSKFRLNSDVEGAATAFIALVPDKPRSEAELAAAVATSAEDKLRGHLSVKARWFVAYGPRGDELKAVRDDKFTKTELAFVAKVVEELRLRTPAPGVRRETFDFPLGAMVRAVVVDDKPWFVVSAWSE